MSILGFRRGGWKGGDKEIFEFRKGCISGSVETKSRMFILLSHIPPDPADRGAYRRALNVEPPGLT